MKHILLLPFLFLSFGDFNYTGMTSYKIKDKSGKLLFTSINSLNIGDNTAILSAFPFTDIIVNKRLDTGSFRHYKEDRPYYNDLLNLFNYAWNNNLLPGWENSYDYELRSIRGRLKYNNKRSSIKIKITGITYYYGRNSKFKITIKYHGKV